MLYFIVPFSILWFIVLRFCVAQVLIKKFLKNQRTICRRFISDVKTKRKDWWRWIDLEIGSEKLIEDRGDVFGHITSAIGHLEFAFFGIVTFLLFRYEVVILNGVEYFFTFFGGWLAIKTVVSYDQWSHKIVGKTYFYLTFLGTLFNIFFATFFGSSLFYLTNWLSQTVQ